MSVVPTALFRRDPGVLRAVHGAVPDVLLPAFEAVTHLGSPATLAAVAWLAYLFGPSIGALDRESAAHLLGVVVGGLALVTALKWWFALPRPPTALRLAATDGYGFPSGHATASALGYGAIAATVRWGTLRHRAGVAAVLVVGISVSRVVLGLHYPVDVLVGAAVGTGYLALASSTAAVDRRLPVLLAWTAAVLAALGVAAGAVAWPTPDGAAALGGAVGTAAGWVTIGRRDIAAGGDHVGRRAAAAGGIALAAGGAWVLAPGPAIVAVTFAVCAAAAAALPGLDLVGVAGAGDG
ncbi:MAG: phosphatase PAP2 family protein [Halobacteriaceae archaeon]